MNTAVTYLGLSTRTSQLGIFNNVYKLWLLSVLKFIANCSCHVCGYFLVINLIYSKQIVLSYKSFYVDKVCVGKMSFDQKRWHWTKSWQNFLFSKKRKRQSKHWKKLKNFFQKVIFFCLKSWWDFTNLNLRQYCLKIDIIEYIFELALS